MATTTAMPSRQLLTALFGSLGNTRWSLSRVLRSDNPLDINGELRGTAAFTALNPSDRDWLYSEEGEIPSAVTGAAAVAGLRWTKKYIWRGSDTGRISVWFVKVAPGPDEADYLFHNFDFSESTSPADANESTGDFVTPPNPPVVVTSDPTTILAAQGNHLCINDMYRTAYAFRIRPETGEVLSWASRHVVKGPKKDQDIVNSYQRLE
ncbi:hypothetical protein N7532_004724 [Penicillium argentinense]|uniref:DUF6314 domain-containing protein n=1 Tax=Penicillium argentinense TaxID=1131581 RepID=A0A9W9FQK3_9EURO|nr:uncharacterized protein N7532_004724 [Penicillium argentinense]KAJ5104195.1 hypothetical protein N7532_004724 [Penicillium argentinense]